MTTSLLLGLILQAVAVALLFVVFRRSMFRRTGTYLLLAMVVFHGVTELLQLASGARSQYRSSIPQHSLDAWYLDIGAACVVYAAAYALVARRSPAPVTAGQVARVLTVFDWRVLAVLTAPLVAIVARGGYHVSVAGPVTNFDPTQSGLAGQFTTLGITLTSISFIARHPRAFVPAFLVEMAAEVLVGQRLDVLTAALATVVGLAVIGRRVRLRAVVAAALIAGFVGLSLNAARAQFGRDEYNNATSATARLSLIARGSAALVTGASAKYDNATQPTAIRIDGNTFAAGETAALAGGTRPAGLGTVVNDAKLAVPSFLAPGKLSTSLADRSEKFALQDHFSLSYSADFIPTQMGAALGYFGPIGLLFFAGLFAVGFGLVDRAAGRRLTAWTYLLTIGSLIAALSYEGTNETYFVTARGVVAAYVLLAGLAWLRTRRSAPRDEHPDLAPERAALTPA
ncbi:hypothetical protein SAMN05443575_1954 [Jatrophihabitans endophyticus]|uniref:Oligosaccharide repeat unit polymerase n=1 Tax=Jatrophihabitans endophyticus TaxID=1206085 RepID=A0A1M5IPZ9_9ACTN|nr:hypothetical protein [Jatrophihabitans endophyticus]SHG29863.1 hypothetical protein SAMN05443575_1954 [Jatrophihabitans endophyticus]